MGGREKMSREKKKKKDDNELRERQKKSPGIIRGQ